MKLFRMLPTALALCVAVALPARAQSLVELYEAARAYDASFQSARSQYDATVASYCDRDDWNDAS